jgi:hypothetical protein
MFPPPIFEITFSLFLESRPGDLDMFHSLGRHGVPGEVSYTVGMQLTVVKSGDDANVYHPDVHAKFVVLVTLP